MNGVANTMDWIMLYWNKLVEERSGQDFPIFLRGKHLMMAYEIQWRSELHSDGVDGQM